MTRLNISQAAKAAGVARGTIQRHIKQGKLSCETNAQGQRLIDTSELIRLYGELQSSDASDAADHGGTLMQREASYTTPLLHQQIKGLQEQVEQLHEEKKQDREDYRQRENRLLTMLESEQEKTKTLMLEYHREKPKIEEIPAPQSGSRWVAYGLSGLILVVSAVALAAFVLLRSGA